MEITVRDLRNHGADVLDRVARGETLTVTRAGVPVARLYPLPRDPLAAQALLERWRRLPQVDPQTLRTELDDTVDATL